MNHPQTNLTHQNQDSPLDSKFAQFGSIDVNSDEQIQGLLNFMAALKPNPEGIKAVKKLLLSYGVPIMIYLKPLYAQIKQPVPSSLQQTLKKLAAIALQMMEGIEIPQLQFIFAYGTHPQKFKKVQKDPLYKQYIHFIKQIGDFNQSLSLGRGPTMQQYRSFIQQNSKSHKYSTLMLRSLQNYILHSSGLESFSDKYQDKEAQVKSESSQQQEEGNDKNISNFYSHQSGNAKKTEQSINCISFSLNSSLGQLDQSGLEKKQENIINNKSETLCCRKYFIEGQQIREAECIRKSFISAKYPFAPRQESLIKKAICSFLNCQGGIVYIGFNQNQPRKRCVPTQFYTESDKENLLKCIRRIAQMIQPNILIQKLYMVQFVPIRSKADTYIPGAYIIKIIVNYGVRDQFYSYQQNGFDYFPFRNDIEIIQKQGRQLLKAYRNVIKTPMPIPQPLHNHPCEKPDLGEQIFTAEQKQILKKKYLKTKQVEVHSSSRRDSNNRTANISNISTQASFKQEKHSKSFNRQQQNASTLGSEIHSHSVQATKKQGLEQNAYFFVAGLDEKHLTPVLAAKNIHEKVSLETFKPQRIVARVEDPNFVEITRKILKKIEAKYKQKGIAVHQISLELQIERLQEAKERLTTIKSKFRTFQNNILKFQSFRDSLQAFLMLERQKFELSFVNKKQ